MGKIFAIIALPFCLALASAADSPAAPTVALFGDSLSAGYGLPPQDGLAPALQRALAKAGARASVVNAAVSGDTTFDGMQRLELALAARPQIFVVALGANDMLRGFPPQAIYNNLDHILRRARESGATPLLAGMLATPNMGADYGERFAAVYARLAKEHQAAFMPFLLEGVAGAEQYNQADGMHPNAEGARLVARNLAKHLLPLLGKP